MLFNFKASTNMSPFSCSLVFSGLIVHQIIIVSSEVAAHSCRDENENGHEGKQVCSHHCLQSSLVKIIFACDNAYATEYQITVCRLELIVSKIQINYDHCL